MRVHKVLPPVMSSDNTAGRGGHIAEVVLVFMTTGYSYHLKCRGFLISMDDISLIHTSSLICLNHVLGGWGVSVVFSTLVIMIAPFSSDGNIIAPSVQW